MTLHFLIIDLSQPGHLYRNAGAIWMKTLSRIVAIKDGLPLNIFSELEKTNGKTCFAIQKTDRI
jgi:hypothetical protein